MTAASDIAIDRLPTAVMNAVRKAEAEDGYRYGPALFDVDGRWARCFISVSFYQGRQWWIRVGDGERRRLTAEDWTRVMEIKL